MPENIEEKIEDKIIDSINLNASGRLIIFKPEVAKKGVNLIIKKKGEYESRQSKALAGNSIIRAQIFGFLPKKKTKEICVSINWQVKMDGDNAFIKNVEIKEFESNKNLYLMFVFFSILRQNIDDFICFLSLEEFKKNADATQDKNILKFESYLSPSKKDKYSKFLINKKDLAKVLLNTVLPPSI